MKLKKKFKDCLLQKIERGNMDLDKWSKEDLKFLNLEENTIVPNSILENVPFIDLKSELDFDRIPFKGGCYWIWTNEPIKHSLHKNKMPQHFSNGEVIYNGIAKDNILSRIKSHLLGEINAGWSAISVDILPDTPKSHRKKVFSTNGKVPYINGIKIKSKEDIYGLFLSDEERCIIKENNEKSIFFRNGINIFENKHKKFVFRVYYIAPLKSISYMGFIEKKWREKYGLPKLCSYSSGR